MTTPPHRPAWWLLGLGPSQSWLCSTCGQQVCYRLQTVFAPVWGLNGKLMTAVRRPAPPADPRPPRRRLPCHRRRLRGPGPPTDLLAAAALRPSRCCSPQVKGLDLEVLDFRSHHLGSRTVARD